MSIGHHPGAVNFWQVAAGTRAATALLLVNRSERPAPIRVRDIDAPFGASASVSEIEARRAARVDVWCDAPTTPGELAGTLSIEAGRETIAVPLRATSIAIPEAPALDAPLRVTAHARESTETDIVGHYTVELPRVPAVRHAPVLELDAVGLPSGASAEFAAARATLGVERFVTFVVRASKQAAARDFPFAVRGRVAGTALELVSATVIFMSWNPPFCSCPDGTPKPTLFKIAERLVNMPDAGGPAGPLGQPTMAEVRVTLDGPALGDCCRQGAKFRLTIVIDSMVGGTNNEIATLWLWAGGSGALPLISATGGKADPIDEGAGNAVNFNGPLPDPSTRAVLQTSHDVEIKCGPPTDCPCTPTDDTLDTSVTLGGGGNPVWVVNVGWRVGVRGRHCVIENRTAAIDYVVFFAGTNIYNPRTGKYIDWFGDDDGDGEFNMVEIQKGTDPDDPTSKPSH
jgi:hypothetical protein